MRAYLRMVSSDFAAAAARERELTARMRDLEEQGLVSRLKVGRRGSPATYRLTRRADSLLSIS